MPFDGDLLMLIDLIDLCGDVDGFIFWVVGILKMWLLMKLSGCLLCC